VSEIPPSSQSPAAAEPPSRSRGRIVALVLTGALGLIACATGAAGLLWEPGRKPTAAQVAAVSLREQAVRWRNRPAGELFPATISAPDGTVIARRIGIAPAAPCRKAVDGPVGDPLVKHGCATVLRATYADGSGTLLTTVGIASMPDAPAADAAYGDLSALGQGKLGVRVVAFPGTVAATFADDQRQKLGIETAHVPYLLFQSVGPADGHPPVPFTQFAQELTFSSAILIKLEAGLAAAANPCTARGVRC
jgi:hypothetical protein